MARTNTDRELNASRAGLMRAIEILMDKVDTHPSPTLADEILALSAEVDLIDRKLAAAARRRKAHLFGGSMESRQ